MFDLFMYRYGIVILLISLIFVYFDKIPIHLFYFLSYSRVKKYTIRLSNYLKIHFLRLFSLPMTYHERFSIEF